MAHAQGLLTQKDLNQFQHWALLYWIWMERRQQMDDMLFQLKEQTWNLFPERWEELYRPELLQQMGIGAWAPDGMGGVIREDEMIPLTENDLDDLDAFMANQEQGAIKRWMRAGQLPPDFQLDTQGIKV